MYINLKFLEEKELFFKEVFLLQLVKQQKFEDCSAYLKEFEEEIRLLTTLGYITSIKGGKKDSEISKLRLSKSGEELLANIEIPEIIEEDLILFEWVKGVYLSKDKKLGNQKKTKLYIALFRTQSGISRNKLAMLLNTFLDDDQNMAYNHILEKAFFSPQNAYNTKFNIDESRIYQYYLTHQEFFDEKFKTLNG